jgi:hypothetical protein
MVVNWRGEYREVDLKKIQEVTGIQISSGNQDPKYLAEYLPIMGPACVNPDMGGIKGTTTYKNVYATGRWICSNIIGTSNTSCFYEPTLHIIDALMFSNFRFCMCRQLFTTICNSRHKLDTNDEAYMLLPCLITDICRTFIGDQEYDDACASYISVLPKETITRGYNLCVQHNWTPEIHMEHVAHQQFEDLSDQDFWRQNNPRGDEDFIDHACSAFRRLNTKLDIVIEQGSSSSAQGGKRKKRR